MKIDWRASWIVPLLFVLLFPWLRKSTEAVNTDIEAAKKKLWISRDWIEHRDDYILWQKELEAKGNVLGGSCEVGDFLNELEAVSKQAKVPIQSIKPRSAAAAGPKDSVGAELYLEGDMISLGRFIYQALNLPGMIVVEKLDFSGTDRSGSPLSANLFISRKTCESR